MIEDDIEGVFLRLHERPVVGGLEFHLGIQPAGLPDVDVDERQQKLCHRKRKSLDVEWCCSSLYGANGSEMVL